MDFGDLDAALDKDVLTDAILGEQVGMTKFKVRKFRNAIAAEKERDQNMPTSNSSMSGSCKLSLGCLSGIQEAPTANPNV